MANFLLIHGALNGAWCWRDLIPALRQLGHDARAIDLPGHGADTTPYQQVTLDLYADAILQALDSPAIVVAHSMGGFPATLAAERAPHQFQRLIYLCAYVPQPGKSLVDLRKEGPAQPLRPAIRMTDDKLGWTVDPARARDIFFHDCPKGTTDFALQHLCIQATQPSAVAVRTGSNIASLQRDYIRCLDDRTIPPPLQQDMTRDWPASRVHSFDSGHSPFFSHPARLAQLLADIATS
ncbi:alpha/beta fold hydrolase [Thalassobius sp. S69A]|uniref:alpha/beta fold hydrolase n=1 Tax=unclassified Thalassovita TaxID=2619711 RepID=UPI000C0CC21F|nr:esterase [Paracoccaceae bacterium]MBT26625.1 esterase [Paracoccaceae bacterium]